MSSGVLVAGAEGHSGKSTIALGLIDALAGTVERVGVFRPVVRDGTKRDYVLELLVSHDAIEFDYDDCAGVSYGDVQRDDDQALSTIVEKYRRLQKSCDSIVVLGSDYTDVGSPAELEFNARVAANLGIPVLLVITGRDPEAEAQRGLSGGLPRSVADLEKVTIAAISEIKSAYAELAAVVVNRAEPADIPAMLTSLQKLAPGVQNSALPEDPVLVAPTVRHVAEVIGADSVTGDPEALEREVLGVIVAAMGLETVLQALKDGYMVLVPGDRSEVLMGVILAHQSASFPSLSGVIVYGGVDAPPSITQLIDGLQSNLPILRVDSGTYETVLDVIGVRGRMAAESQRKYDRALALFRDNVDVEALLGALNVSRPAAVTPLMFEYDLLERARAAGKHIVLPEGSDDRILRAASTLLARRAVDITLLGDEQSIRARAAELGLDIEDAKIVSTADDELAPVFSKALFELRKDKGLTPEEAQELVTDVSYFGTMMVHLGYADGMVSGATHTTAHTITPALKIIKTQPGVSVVSSVFFMCLADRVLVYGDCAIVPDPTAEQLADIASSAAKTAKQFGIDPRIAMLSYSTGASGSGADVDKVRAATAMLHEHHPELAVEGPIQYDAAAEPSVAKTKMPDSEVAGRASVFIFPDLNTGNNTYKAVQRSAGAVAIGPVLQGLNKPVNDLSRGATVRDIVNTVAITAIQAGGLSDD